MAIWFILYVPYVFSSILIYLFVQYSSASASARGTSSTTVQYADVCCTVCAERYQKGESAAYSSTSASASATVATYRTRVYGTVYCVGNYRGVGARGLDSNSLKGWLPNQPQTLHRFPTTALSDVADTFPRATQRAAGQPYEGTVYIIIVHSTRTYYHQCTVIRCGFLVLSTNCLIVGCLAPTAR